MTGAESWGLATGLQIATELKITHIEVGTDSAILVNLIHGTLCYSHLQLHELDEYFYALFYRETKNRLYIFLLLWNYSFHGLLLKLLMLRFSESFLKKGVW